MHVASRAARGRADAGCWHQHWRSCNELCHGARKHIKSSTAEGRCLLRSFFALVQVQDLENVALAQRFPVSGQLGPFSRNGLEMIASGVVHDAAKIVRSKSNEGVADAVVLGSDIGVGVRLVLVQPTLLLDVVPMDNEVRALAMVLLHRVGALLLVIHAQDMAELVDEVPDIALGVTPSHVHRRPDGVARSPSVQRLVCVCASSKGHLLLRNCQANTGAATQVYLNQTSCRRPVCGQGLMRSPRLHPLCCRAYPPPPLLTRLGQTRWNLHMPYLALWHQEVQMERSRIHTGLCTERLAKDITAPCCQVSLYRLGRPKVPEVIGDAILP
eukprot:CAMPEP_0177554856 /NCGR_PEP_ID=MMETSP0369-20130122/68198_1 /TAXON_ID=447022 ORGANISM="Scrippsiella hangoei-like, Strain SHHI-4" /NCGR_SAMPLE_ID=MMETSP0369 /ASSEMBLY_ACC=CAM_ASM_000364 /LENGTH=327 /DNA_ID=CAMNT_0019040891 /DNA_START=132 /DNA_END=1111 /DNA_ORIENTATION=+